MRDLIATILIAGCLLSLAAVAFAETPAPAPKTETPSEAEIAKALAADATEKKKTETPAATAPSATRSLGSVGRFFQSLNPDLSAIIDFAAGYYSNDAVIRSGDDPGKTGFNVQEVEVALQAVVDPYFRADIFLTIPNLSGIEVEEAYLTTTSLPANLQVKAGIFRAGLGRQNPQHLHLQDFTRRPALNALFLGSDGLRAPGLELNWLVPKIPFYLLLSASAFSVDPSDANSPLATFGGGARYDFAYVGSAKSFFPLSEATSLSLGLNFAKGKTSQQQNQPNITSASPCFSALFSPVQALWFNTMCDGFDSYLYGADVYLKWKPANTAKGYAQLAWQSEFFLRHVPGLVIAPRRDGELEGGLYSQLVLQASRRWFIAGRGEVLGLPSGASVLREYAGALSVTLVLSDFARLRAYGEARFPRGQAVNGAAFLQLEAAIGAHRAHLF